MEEQEQLSGIQLASGKLSQGKPQRESTWQLGTQLSSENISKVYQHTDNYFVITINEIKKV